MSRLIALVGSGLLLVIGLAGCGIGESASDAQAAQQARDYDKLAASYRQIQGVYEGTLATGDAQFPQAPGTLIIYVVESDAGSNIDGSHKNPPILQGRFRLDKAVSDTDYVILKGDYREATGRLILTTESSGQSAGGNGGAGQGVIAVGPTLSLTGSIAGASLRDATVTHSGGDWGVFQGVRVSSVVHAPVGGAATSDRDRLNQIYSVAAGRYVGVIRGPTPKGVQLQLFISIGADASIALRGRMVFAGGVPGVAEIQLSASHFDALTGEIFLAQNPDLGGHFSLFGFIRNGHLQVTVVSRDGTLGTLIGQRQD